MMRPYPNTAFTAAGLLRATFPAVAGVNLYLELGAGTMSHRLSTVDVYGGFFSAHPFIVDSTPSKTALERIAGIGLSRQFGSRRVELSARDLAVRFDYATGRTGAAGYAPTKRNYFNNLMLSVEMEIGLPGPNKRESGGETSRP